MDPAQQQHIESAVAAFYSGSQEQMAAADRYCTSFEPFRAIAAMCGVCDVGWPKQLKSPYPTSSPNRITTLGFEPRNIVAGDVAAALMASRTCMISSKYRFRAVRNLLIL